MDKTLESAAPKEQLLAGRISQVNNRAEGKYAFCYFCAKIR